MSTNLKTDIVGAAAAFKQELLSSLSPVKTETISRLIPDFVKDSVPVFTPSSSPVPTGESLRTTIFNRESSGNYSAINDLGYAGGYQFGAMALEDVGMLKKGSGKLGNAAAMNDPNNWTGRGGVTDLTSFLAAHSLQDQLFQENFDLNRKRLVANGTITDDMSEDRAVGFTTAAHLLGATGTADGLHNTDALGTKGYEFFNLGKASVNRQQELSSTETAIASIKKELEEPLIPVAEPEAELEKTVSNVAAIKSAPVLDEPLTDEVTQQAAELRKRNEESLSAFIARSNAPAAAIEPTASAATAEVDSRDPTLHPTMNAWVKVNGIAPQEIANYYQEKRFRDRKNSFKRTKIEQELRETDAWATDAELGTYIGGLKQNITNFGFGTARVGGHLAALPFTVVGGLARAKVDDRGVSLYDKSLYSSLTPDENAYLDSVPKTTPWIKSAQTKETRRALMDRAYRSEDMANTISKVTGETGFIGKPLHDLINPLTKDILDDDLRLTYETHPALQHFEAAKIYATQKKWGSAVASVATGVVGLAWDGSFDMYLNPSATFEYIAENIPQLAIGAVSRTALLTTNLGYGADIYSDALADYKTEHGRSPTREEASHMAMWALSASIMEQVADATILKQFNIFPGGTTATASVLSKFVPAQLKETVKAVAASTAGRVASTVVNNPVTRTALAASRGYVAEGVTETYQTAVEENLARLNTNFDGFNLFKGGTIGSAIGGTLSSSGRTVRELVNLGSSARGNINAGSDISPERAEISELTVAGAQTGDVTSLVDESKPETYSPMAAVEALTYFINQEGITEEAREQSIGTINKLIDEQNSTYESLNNEYDALEKELVDGVDTLSKNEVKRINSQLDILAFQADAAKTIAQKMSIARDQSATNKSISEEEIETTVNAAAAEASPEQAQAANKIILTMLNNPSSVTESNVQKLLESNSLSETQKAFVNNFSEAHSTINSLNDTDSVNSDIRLGRHGFKGILQYEANIAAAIREGDQAKASQELEGLTNFLQDHTNKLEALEKGFEQSNSLGKKSRVHLVRTPNEGKGWDIVTKTPKNWNRKRTGGWDFHPTNKGTPQTEKLIKRIKEENVALEAAVKQHQSALSLAFNTPAAAGAAPDIEVIPEVTTTDEVSTDAGLANGAAVEPDQVNNDQVEESNAETIKQTTAEEIVNEEISKQEETNQNEEVEVAVKEEVAETVEKDLEQGQLEPMLNPDEQVDGNMDTDTFLDPSTSFLAAYFNQRKPDETSGSVNPLVRVKDFMSFVYDGITLDLDKLSSFIAGNPKLSPLEVEQFALFRAKQQAWKADIEKNINDSASTVRKNGLDYKYEDYAQEFKGNVPENLSTAISMAAFLWLSENAGGTGINTHRAIRQMLGLDNDAVLSFNDVQRFADVGTRRDFVIQEMGKKVRQALEITTNKNVPLDELQKFELAMGAHVLALLQQQGLTTATNEKTSEDAEPSTYIKATRVGRVPIQENEEIVTVSRLANRFLNKLTAVESPQIPPATSPGKFEQTLTKIKRLVPAIQQTIAKKVSKRPHTIRQDMQRVRNALSEIGAKQIAGYVLLDDGSNYHEAIRLSTESRNEEIDRQMASLNDFEEEIGTGNFYTVPVIWKHQRTGQASNTINTQTSKLQRHNISMNNWNVEVDPSVDSMTRRNFMLTVAQGMGIKVDKQPIATSLKQLDLLMEDPRVQDALTVVFTIEAGIEITEEQEAALILITQGIKVGKASDELKVGGENYHTLDALVNLNAYLTALEDGKTFNSQMMFEVDGVTNGPALALIMMGQVTTALGNKFGLFSDENYTSHAEYISEPEHQDLYETILGSALNNINEDKMSLALLNGLGSLIKLNRSSLKTPIQMMFFGANVNKAIASIGNEIIENYYLGIREISNDESTTEAQALVQANKLVDQLNLLLTGKAQLSHHKNGAAALSTMLNDFQTDMIGENFSNTIGKTISAVLNAKFKDFLNNRRVINEAGVAAWARYNAAFEFMVDYNIQLKKDDKSIATDSNNQPLQELTDQDIDGIKAFLKPMEPVMHTPLSKADGNLDAGIRADQKDYIAVGNDSATYAQSVHFGQDIPTAETRRGKSTTRSITVRGSKEGSQDPGVATFILMIHAMDSAISTYAINKMMSLNIHDAHGFGIADIITGAKELNKQTFDILSNFSVPTEIVDSLQRSMDAEAALVKERPELSKVLSEIVVGKDSVSVDNLYLADARQVALKADLAKLAYLSETQSIDQYSFPGGSYEVTADQRLDVANRKAAITAQLETTNEPKTVAEQEVTEDAQKMPEDTPWGKTGVSESTVRSDPRIVRYLEENPNPNAKDLARWLYRLIQPSTVKERADSFSKAQFELLKQIGKTIGNDIKVNYITPFSKGPVTEGVKTANGWYSLDEHGEAINIKSPAFVHSGITPQLLLHELTHAALAQEIDNPSSANSVAAVAELEQILAAVEQHIKDNNIEGFNAQTANVQELVAYGMTNLEFQGLLKDVNFVSTANTTKSTLRSFIENITKLIFGDKATESTQNAMGSLIADVGLLFEASQTRPSETAGAKLKLRMEQDAPISFTTGQVYNGLGSQANAEVLSPVHDNHLRSVLDTVVNVVYGNTGALKPMAERAAPATAEDVFLTSLSSGVLPFSSTLTNELNMTDQEAFVAESVELALRDATNRRSTSTNRNELQKLFKQARKEITVEKLYGNDWASASRESKIQAARIHAIIFDVKPSTTAEGRSDYLSQFAAAALTYQPLREQLGLIRTPVDNAVYSEQNLLGALTLWFNRVMDKFAAIITKTYQGQSVDQQLMQLATNLATIEAKEKSKIQRRKEKPQNLIDQASNKISEGVKEGISAVANSRILKDSSSNVVKAFGNVVSTVAGERTEQVMDAINKIADRDSSTRLGALREIINEFRTGRPAMIVHENLLVMENSRQQERLRLKIELTNIVETSFGSKLTKEQSVSLTKAIIKTDVSVLVNDFTLAEIEQLLSNDQVLELAITALETKLTSKHANYYKAQAEYLGYYQATGKSKPAILMMNAHNIAFLWHTEDRISNESDQTANDAVDVIDQLATLYALRHTDGAYKKKAANLMRDEAGRGKGINGVDFILKMHAAQKEKAKDKLFDGKDALMQKGYVKEIYNPYITVVATNAIEGKKLEAAGYKQVGSQVLGKDSTDFSGEKRLYKIRDKGMSPTVSGILSRTALQAKGAKVVGNIIDEATGEINVNNQKSLKAIELKKRQAARKMLEPGYAFSNNAKIPNSMVPVFNEKGEVTSYRYLMEEASKDSLLEKDNRVEVIIGASEAAIYDKFSGAEIAIAAIDATKAQYDADYLQNTDAYIDVSSNSNDPVVREHYRLLPAETKRYIRKTFGRNGMYVKNEMYNITMGFRKFSISDAFHKLPDEQLFIEKVLVTSLETIIGKTAALRVMQAENIWQEIVKVIKDSYVIKSLFTLLGNEVSNATLLYMQGVPMQDIIKGKVEAIRATSAYNKDRRKFYELSTKVDNGYVTGNVEAAYRQEMLELQERMRTNPIAVLVDAGMYQTLIEDVKTEDDSYSYKSRLSTVADEKTSMVPAVVKRAANIAFVTQSTDLYKVLHRATVYSDFTSRYVMFKHLTERSKDPVSPEVAIRKARKAFVNYDTPTHKSLQYLNDMGLLWFTKYYIRMQGVILELVRDNPLRAVALSGFDYYADITDILDSSALQNSPLNFGTGAFELQEGLESIITINTAL